MSIQIIYWSEYTQWLCDSTYCLLINNNYPSAFVCWCVELVKQEEEHHCVHADPPHKCSRIIAINEQ